MKVNRIRQNLLPLLTAMIWGGGFVAQSVGAEHMGAFTFNALRSLVAFAFLLVLCAVLRLLRRQNGPAAPESSWRELVLGGLCCGAALAVSSYFQQKGLETSTAGKGGFITALYIVIVPIAGRLLGRRVPRAVWASVALAVVGLYCLCINEAFTITAGDRYLLICAFCFSVQILTVDHFSRRVDGVALSCAQFLVTGLLSSVGMLTETMPAPAVWGACVWPVLYAGVFSSGFGYTLQILAQKDGDPTVVSLLLSMESVFAVLAGALFLHDRMSGREYLGCLLMLAAVVLAQLPDRRAGQAAGAERA